MKVRIYVEGGGNGKALQSRCRAGFSQFFQSAGLKGRMPAIVACGSRNDAYDRFCTALSTAKENEFPILLVDSEQAVSQSPWLHLQSRDGWGRPNGADDQQAHLMVECMESWFLADVQCLEKFFGEGFVSKHVQKGSNVEAISKTAVFNALKMATRHCKKCKKTDGYDKGKHSFEILGQLDPDLVKKASKHTEQLLATLEDTC